MSLLKKYRQIKGCHWQGGMDNEIQFFTIIRSCRWILKEEGDMWRSEEPGYFHICTDGNAVPWIFQDDEDFIAGVNRIGICSVTSETDTIAYTLMDNHGHFIMYGTLLSCKRFINTYKCLTGKHISRKYKIIDPLPEGCFGLRRDFISIQGKMANAGSGLCSGSGLPSRLAHRDGMYCNCDRLLRRI